MVIALDPPSEGLRVGGGADRDNHELLKVHVVVGVSTPVDDVEHWNREHARVDTPDGAEERQAHLVGSRPGHGQGHAEDGVRAQSPFVVRTVGFDHCPVDSRLVGGIAAPDHLGQLGIDVGHRRGHALAPPGWSAISKLDSLEPASGRSAGNHGPPRGAAV